MPVRYRPLQERFTADVAERYRVERELGRGGAAVVYLAVDRKHGREVALKVLDPATAPASGAARFHQEIALLARLQHPHILPLHDSGEAAGSLYFVTPYVAGESLRARLRRDGALPPADALRLAGEVAGALAYAHARGVVHRDVKPENVLLTAGAADPEAGPEVQEAAPTAATLDTPSLGSAAFDPLEGDAPVFDRTPAARPAPGGMADWHAVVCDFGIARLTRRPDAAPEGAPPGDPGEAHRTEVGGVVGTLAYMAPEQAEGAPDVDARADVWALGLVLYEMLTGRLPHADVPSPTPARVRRYHTPPPPLALAGVPREALRRLDALFARALAPAPGERFASARELAAAMGGVQAAMAAARAGLPAWIPRTRGARWMAAASVVALAGVGVAAAVAAREGEATAAASGSGAAGTPGVVGVAVLPFEEAFAAPGGSDGTMAAAVQPLFMDAIEALPDIRAVDAATLIPPDGRRRLPVAELRASARRLGAEYLAAGRVIGRGERVEVVVDLYAARDGRRLLQSRAAAAAGAADSAVGRVALQVVRDVAAREGLLGPSRRLLLTATSSALALGHLLQGQRMFRDANFDAAADEFRRAVAADSNCALAYHRLSVVRVWQHDFPAALAAAEAGLDRRARMPAEWVRLLEAQRHYARRDGASAIVSFQRSVVDQPGNVDGWFGLGEALFHFGWFAGHTSADAERALAWLVQLDSAFAPIDNHLFDLALLRGDAASARRALARLRPDDRQRPPREALLPLLLGRPAERDGALRRLATADRWTLSEVFAVLSLYDFDSALADTVAGILVAPGRSPDDRLRGAAYRLVSGAALGQWSARMTAWEREAPDSGLDGWVASAALAGFDDHGRLALMLARARAVLHDGRPLDFAAPDWNERRDAFLLLTHRAVIAGDSAEVRRLLAILAPARERASDADPIPPAAHAALQARLALLAGDTVRAIALLTEGLARIDEPYTMFYPLRAMAPERRLLVTLLTSTAGHGAALRDAAVRRWAASLTTSRSLADRFYANRARQPGGRTLVRRPTAGRP